MVRLENDGVWVTLKETIAAHHEEVFACLTTEAGLIRWFPVACQVELRTGGQMKLAFDAKFRRPLTIPILEYHEDGRVSWGWYPGIGDEMAGDSSPRTVSKRHRAPDRTCQRCRELALVHVQSPHRA